jgi:hypothetical protein
MNAVRPFMEPGSSSQHSQQPRYAASRTAWTKDVNLGFLGFGLFVKFGLLTAGVVQDVSQVSVTEGEVL